MMTSTLCINNIELSRYVHREPFSYQGVDLEKQRVYKAMHTKKQSYQGMYIEKHRVIKICSKRSIELSRYM